MKGCEYNEYDWSCWSWWFLSIRIWRNIGWCCYLFLCVRWFRFSSNDRYSIFLVESLFQRFTIFFFAGEESKNPQRAIPISICLTLFVCTLIYCGVAIVITLMVRISALWISNQTHVYWIGTVLQHQSRRRTSWSISSCSSSSIQIYRWCWSIDRYVYLFVNSDRSIQVVRSCARHLHISTRFFTAFATCPLCHSFWWSYLSIYRMDSSTSADTCYCNSIRWHRFR